MTLTFGSLFSGIGGFDLGLEKSGMICKWQSEVDPFCNKVLARHWPDVKRYGDIKEIGEHNLETVDLICGGFPCQPFSVAGKQRGKEDDRYLWPEMFRVISELKPTWVIGENVPGIIRMELDKVRSDLEAEGYEVQPLIISACAVDAPHRRDRVWILAYNDSLRMERKGTEQQATGISRKSQIMADTNKQGLEERKGKNTTGRGTNGRAEPCRIAKWLSEPPVGRVANGIPRRVDRLRSLGNAVVPQIVEILGRFIIKIEDQT